jgi:glycerophosphoryl diester phosphodiesterase
MKIIAHRGYSFKAPENSISAFKEAFKISSDGIELDIHLTKDDKIVVMHDERTKRTSNGDLLIEDTTLSELKKLDIGSWKGKEWEEERIPELSEVFDIVPKQTEIVIEIKVGIEIIPMLTQYVNESKKNDSEITFISFNDSIYKIKEKIPNIDALVLYDKYENIDEIIEKTKANNCDGLDLNWAHLTSDIAKKVKDADLQLYVWTVDDVKVAKEMKLMGVDGLTTNNPELMIKELI